MAGAQGSDIESAVVVNGCGDETVDVIGTGHVALTGKSTEFIGDVLDRRASTHERDTKAVSGKASCTGGTDALAGGSHDGYGLIRHG